MSAFRILIVEDDQEVLDLFSRALERQGYSIASAATGLEAVSSAKTFHPDLVLMDVSLPDMDGPTAVKRLCDEAAGSGGKAPGVIFITGAITKKEEKKDYRVTIDGRDYPTIAKPIAYQDLLLQIQNYIQQQKSA